MRCQALTLAVHPSGSLLSTPSSSTPCQRRLKCSGRCVKIEASLLEPLGKVTFMKSYFYKSYFSFGELPGRTFKMTRENADRQGRIQTEKGIANQQEKIQTDKSKPTNDGSSCCQSSMATRWTDCPAVGLSGDRMNEARPFHFNLEQHVY